MGRKPTGRPRGRQKGSGTLGLGSEDAHQRLTIRIPQALYNRLEAFAEGRHYTRGTAQLAGCVREAIEHWLVCPNKRQTMNRTSSLEDNIRQTVNSNGEREEINRQTVNSTTAIEDNIRQTVNVPALVEDAAHVPVPFDAADLDAMPVAHVDTPQQPAQLAGLPYDPSKFSLGKLCPRGHAYQNTGKTLLRLPGYRCLACEAAKKREKRSGANRP